MTSNNKSLVTCQICERTFPQITGTHLKSHNITFKEYKEKYPNIPTVSEEVGKKISTKLSGRERSQEHCDALSSALKMTFVNGRVGKSGTTGMKMSDETKKRMSDAQTGRKHSEETKEKIGVAHRGRTLPEEQIENARIGLLKAREENGGGFNKGVTFTDAAKKNLSDAAKNRPPELVQEKVDAMNNARRGQKESDEVRMKKSDSRTKYMVENSDKLGFKFFDTKPELEFESILISLGLEYTKQYHTSNPHRLYDFKVGDVLIEIDGPYHYNPKLHKTIESFDKQVERDEFKNKNAIAKGFKIGRIQVTNSIPANWKDILLEQNIIL